MARMAKIPFKQALNVSGHFVSGHPIGLVLHRTEASYDQVLHTWTVGPNPKKSSAHFLVGKKEYQVLQVVDTSTIANHALGDANRLFVGIEFESILSSPGFRGGQDPATNADGLTVYQCDIGAEIVDWICHAHRIPKVGPPSKQQMIDCGGRWHGVLSYYDLSNSGLFRTDHGDEYSSSILWGSAYSPRVRGS